MNIPAPYVQPVYTDDIAGTKIEVPVSKQFPLPVQIEDGNELFVRIHNPSIITEPVTIDTLLVGSITASSTVRDLLGNTDSNAPTLTQAAPYRRFILFLFIPSAATVTLTLKGRATDLSGVPFSSGWVDLVTDSITTTTTNTWHRVVFQASDGAPLAADQYRIEITSSASQTILYSLKGER